MSQPINVIMNDVNGAQTARKGPSSGKGYVRQQACLDRQSATAKQHYNEVASSGCSGYCLKKRPRTKKFCNSLPKTLIGSINTLTCKEESKLYRIFLQCKALKQSITFIQESHMPRGGYSAFLRSLVPGTCCK